MLLSILTTSIYERHRLFTNLIDKLYPQINGKEYLEFLTFVDDKKKSVGEKRNSLIEQASGEYIVFIDDDDLVSDDYIREITIALVKKPDCVTFDMNMNGTVFNFGLNYDDYNKNQLHKKPNHICVIKKDIIIDNNIKFPEWNRGEDDEFSRLLFPFLETEYRIDKTLYFYNFDPNVSTYNFSN